jgi:hypothetical protein
MKNLKYIGLIFLFLSFLTCARERPRDIFKKINNAIKEKNEDALKNCYTKETQVLFSKLDEVQGSDIPWYKQIIEAGVQREPKIISEKIENDRAFLVVEQNQRRVNLSLVKVQKEWKLDLTKELSFILSIIEQQKLMEEKQK